VLSTSYCELRKREEWIAPPDADLPRPMQTKLFAGDLILSNPIEFADWQADPVQPIVCEWRWHPRCCANIAGRLKERPEQSTASRDPENNGSNK